jgi:putative ABC transport system ATP-binding protein
MAALEARGIWKAYAGGRPVLRGINLSVPRGGSLLVHGRDGSGKSTLLQLLACVDYPSRGKVFVEGVDATALGEPQRAVLRRDALALLPQGPTLAEELSLRQNLALAVKMGRRGRQGEVEELLRLMDLLPVASRKPRELSPGEARRAAVARAIVHGPRILLADEPLAGLPSVEASRVLEALRVLRNQTRMTLIMTAQEPTPRAASEAVKALKGGRLR